MKFILGETNIRCRDLEKSRKFYEEVLGFQFDEIESGCVRLSQGERRILLMPLEEGEPPRVTFDVSTPSLSDAKERFQSAGHSVQEQEYQGSCFLVVQDPDGLEIEVLEQSSAH